MRLTCRDCGSIYLAPLNGSARVRPSLCPACRPSDTPLFDQPTSKPAASPGSKPKRTRKRKA